MLKTLLNSILHTSHIDVASAVATRVADLVSENRTIRLFSEVDQEIILKLHPTVLSIHVDDKHHGALVAHLRVELLVPGGEEGGGHVQPLPVQTELQHLRSSFYALSFSIPHPGLHRDLLVLCYFDWPALLDGTSKEDLSRELGMPGVSDVILPDITVEPVREVEILVIHADDDVSHHTWHFWQDPTFHLFVRYINNLLSCPVTFVCFVESVHLGKES